MRAAGYPDYRVSASWGNRKYATASTTHIANAHLVLAGILGGNLRLRTKGIRLGLVSHTHVAFAGYQLAALELSRERRVRGGLPRPVGSRCRRGASLVEALAVVATHG